MDYGAVLSRAWRLTWQHRFLWWLGLLAMFTEGGGAGGGGVPGRGSFPSNNDSEKESALLPGSGTPAGLWVEASQWRARVAAGDFPSPQQMREYLQEALSRLGPMAALLPAALALMLAMMALLLWLSLCAKAGLILSVDRLDTSGEELGFGSAFHAGRRYFWSLLGLGLLVFLILLAGLTVLAAPLVALVLANRSTGAIIAAMVLGIGAVLVLIVMAVYLGILVQVGNREIVLQGRGAVEAMQAAHGLARRQLGAVLVTWLITIALGLGYGLGVLLVLLLVGGVLAGLGVGVYFALKTVGVVVYAVVAGLALIAGLCILGGWFTALVSSFWTLAYRALGRLGVYPGALTSLNGPPERLTPAAPAVRTPSPS